MGSSSGSLGVYYEDLRSRYIRKGYSELAGISDSSELLRAISSIERLDSMLAISSHGSVEGIDLLKDSYSTFYESRVKGIQEEYNREYDSLVEELNRLRLREVRDTSVSTSLRSNYVSMGDVEEPTVEGIVDDALRDVCGDSFSDVSSRSASGGDVSIDEDAPVWAGSDDSGDDDEGDWSVSSDDDRGYDSSSEDDDDDGDGLLFEVDDEDDDDASVSVDGEDEEDDELESSDDDEDEDREDDDEDEDREDDDDDDDYMLESSDDEDDDYYEDGASTVDDDDDDDYMLESSDDDEDEDGEDDEDDDDAYMLESSDDEDDEDDDDEFRGRNVVTSSVSRTFSRGSSSSSSSSSSSGSSSSSKSSSSSGSKQPRSKVDSMFLGVINKVDSVLGVSKGKRN